MAVDRSRWPPAPRPATPRPTRALTVTRRTSFMLSGAQLGITVTGLLVGYVAEPLIGESLGALLGGVGVPTGVGVGIGAVLALLFSTLVQMLFGELFPKNLAIARPEPVARWLARSTVALPQGLRLADLGVRPGVEPAAAGAADRAGARRRARRHRPRPRAHRRGVAGERRPAGRAVHDARPDPRLPQPRRRARDDPAPARRHRRHHRHHRPSCAS